MNKLIKDLKCILIITLIINCFLSQKLFAEYKFENEMLDESVNNIVNGRIDVNVNEADYKYNILEFGVNGNDQNDDTQGIQNALNKAKEELIKKSDKIIEIYFPKGEYLVSKRLDIFSNTKLVLDNNATIKNSNAETTEALLTARHIDDSGNICTGKQCKHGGYTQWKNIILEGGTWDFNNDGSNNVNGLMFAHGQNLVIRDTIMINSAGHTLNPSCSKDVLIENVTIKDEVSSEPKKSDTTNEVLHLDSASTGEPGSYPLDGTPVKNVIIQNCTFDNVLCGIGSHSNYKEEDYFGDNIVIRNNNFNNIKCYCVNLFAHKNVEIYNNTAIGGTYEKNISDDEKRAYGFVQTYRANAKIYDNNVSNFEHYIVNSYYDSTYQFESDNNDIAKKFYILTFNSNGGKGKMEPEIYEYGKELKIKKNEFTKLGYRFLGWVAFNNYPERQKIKCYGDWYTQKEINSNSNIRIYTYLDEQYIRTLSWWHHSEVIMTAQWMELVTIKDELNCIENIIELDGKKYLICKNGNKASNLLEDVKINDNVKDIVNSQLKIRQDSKFLANESSLKTDQEVAIEDSEEKTGKVVVVKGDLNSDGNVDLRDLVKLNNYRINKEKVESQWTVTQKIAFKSLKNSDITDENMGDIGYRDIVILNNCRIKDN